MRNVVILSVSIIFIGIFSVQARAEIKPSLAEGEKIYQWYCTPCHGIKGDGKGFNARNLDPRPAVHTDSKFMSKRTDKDLYDVINGGGRAAGKSALMPPWGDTFSETQIKSLILYLRNLCKCRGS